MKSIFLGKSRRASIDKIKDNVFLYEAPDGYHFITADSVIPRKDGTDPIVLLADGVLCSHSATTTKDVVETLLLNVDFAKWSGREGGLGMSTMFGRGFAKLMAHFPKIIVLIIVAYVLIAGALGG